MGVIMTDSAERPSYGVSQPLVIAAAAFAASTAFGSVVVARENVEGAPFDVRLPISVRTGPPAGRGSGLSALADADGCPDRCAPWPPDSRSDLRGTRSGGHCGNGDRAGDLELYVAPQSHRHDRHALTLT